MASVIKYSSLSKKNCMCFLGNLPTPHSSMPVVSKRRGANNNTESK